MRTQVPVAVAPAHGRRVERGKQRDPRFGRLARVNVVGEDVAARAPVELHLDGLDRGQGFSRGGDRPAGPPPDVVVRAGPERPKPASHQLRPSFVNGHLGDPVGKPPLDRAPAELTPDPGAERATATDLAVQGEMEEDLLGDADRRLVRLAARERDLLAKPWVERRQVRGRRLAAFTHSGQPGLLQLLEQGCRVRADTRFGEHLDGPSALGRADGPGRGRMDDGEGGDRDQEEGPAHREVPQDGAILVQLALDLAR